MLSRWRRNLNSTGIIWLTMIAVTVFIGCSSSPLAALYFAQNAFVDPNLGAGGGDPTTQPPGGTNPIQTVCDLDPERRGIFVVVQNEAQQFVRLTMTFVASAGAGGFVCDTEVNNYFNAGYRTAVLGVGGVIFIGCDPIRLLGGDSLLTLRVADTLAQNVGGDPNNAPVAQPPLNGGRFIPLPELIVLGDEDPIFICTGNNLCTQRGFVYSDIANNPIAFIDVARTQDTVCNAGSGTVPEWRLGNPNVADNTIQPFQFPSGGTIVITVLDRSTNANPNVNQVVWAVFDVDGNPIHGERR